MHLDGSIFYSIYHSYIRWWEDGAGLHDFYVGVIYAFFSVVYAMQLGKE